MLFYLYLSKKDYLKTKMEKTGKALKKKNKIA